MTKAETVVGVHTQVIACHFCVQKRNEKGEKKSEEQNKR